MAQVGALMREFVLEKLLAGEVLEIPVIDPALKESCPALGRNLEGSVRSRAGRSLEHRS
jgi:hypothetical protein